MIVEEAGKPAVKDDAAEERLAHLLPRELVPYFFFDGEDVQFLAEASDDARAQAMERLLSLSFVTGVEEQLRAVVKEWQQEALPTLRQDRARRLKDVSSRKAQLTRLRAERREAEVGGGERATAYHSLEQEFAAANRTIGDLESRLEQQCGKIAAKQAEAQKAEAELAELGRRHRLAEKSAGKLRIAVGLRETLEVFRKRSRAARRQEIETAVNRHFRRLMTGHRMIDRIAIDEEFVMRFLDADGVEFGQLTVSHGMRQLAVTALLWALKDVSGRALPIIVDTPLARIDKENQQNLLTQYYPNAAEQVIILATDSEIDDEKFALLRGHLGVQFRLDNPDGQSTHVRRLPFVDRLTEGDDDHG